MKTILTIFILSASALGQQAPATAPAPTELEQVKAERDALRNYIKDYQAWILKAYQLQITTINACIGQPPAEVPPTPAPAAQEKK